MKKIKMIIKDLKASRINLFYDIILLEEDGSRAIDISVGEKEAESMAIYMDKLAIPRPLTYDVFIDIMDKFSLSVKEIVISDFFEGNYSSSVLISDGKNEKQFDMRSSDAINLALRTDCPIYVYENILDVVGFDCCKLLTESSFNVSASTIENIDNLSVFGINMLQDLLKDALEKEDYITASILRDKIKNREQ